MTVWRQRIACSIPKPANTHSQQAYVTLIAFTRQQWLREHASMLRYTYIVFLPAVTEIVGVSKRMCMNSKRLM